MVRHHESRGIVQINFIISISTVKFDQHEMLHIWHLIMFKTWGRSLGYNILPNPPWTKIRKSLFIWYYDKNTPNPLYVTSSLCVNSWQRQVLQPVFFKLHLVHTQKYEQLNFIKSKRNKTLWIQYYLLL